MNNFLYLIRQPSVQQDPAIPSTHWQLSRLGWEQSRKLAELEIWHTTPISVVYTSAELKAIQTAEIISEYHPRVERRALMSLNEAQRSIEYLSVEKYQDSAYRFFTFPDKVALSGWARSSAVRTLVVGTYEDIIRDLKRQQKSAAIISHGMALTLLRAYIKGDTASYEDWRSIPFGALATVEVSTGKLIQDFVAVEDIIR